MADGGPGDARELRAYPVRPDGSVGPYAVLHTFGTDYRGPHRGIEGLCLDADDLDHLYVTSAEGTLHRARTGRRGLR